MPVAVHQRGRERPSGSEIGLPRTEVVPDRAVLTVPGLEKVTLGLQSLATKLTAIEERQAEIEAMLAELRDFVVGQRTIKEAYSPVEVAEILGKKPYTVREWCRLKRINARKRPYGRGDADEWEIPHKNWSGSKPTAYFPFAPNTESIAVCC
jgi:hypothetical protein